MQPLRAILLFPLRLLCRLLRWLCRHLEPQASTSEQPPTASAITPPSPSITPCSILVRCVKSDDTAYKDGRITVQRWQGDLSTPPPSGSWINYGSKISNDDGYASQGIIGNGSPASPSDNYNYQVSVLRAVADATGNSFSVDTGYSNTFTGVLTGQQFYVVFKQN